MPGPADILAVIVFATGFAAFVFYAITGIIAVHLEN